MSDKIQLKDPRPTKTVALPSFPESKVEIWPSLLVRDFQVISKAGEGADAGFASLPLFIKSWNFDCEVSAKSIDELPSTDLVFLFEEIKKFGEEQKKS